MKVLTNHHKVSSKPLVWHKNRKMIRKIDSTNLKGKGPIKILFPRLFTENKDDTGIASIGRIDHSFFEGDHLIPMHPHINDEIVTYIRSGHLQRK